MRTVLIGAALLAVLFMFGKRSGGKAMNAKTLSQSDPRWGSLRVGNSSSTYSSIGCVATAVCVAVNTLRAVRDQNAPAITPDMLRPGFLCSADDYIGGSIKSEQVLGKLGCVVRGRLSDIPRTQGGIAQMRTLLDGTFASGGVAILRVDYDLSTPSDNHSVVAFASFGNTTASRRYFAVDPAQGVTIELNFDLFCQRTANKTYSVVGVQPIFLA